MITSGSHLCAPNDCLRYRPAARRQTEHTSTGHLGLRCVAVVLGHGSAAGVRAAAAVGPRAGAALEAVKAQGAGTRRCARGALDGLDAAPSSGGLRAAAHQLGALAGKCRFATGS